MAEYALEEPCEFIYRIKAVTKIVDGDTVDCVFDLGFDVMFHSRVRLLGIDTPESRTRDKVEKLFGLAAKKALKEILKKDVVLKTFKGRGGEDAKGKFGRILGDFSVYHVATDSWRMATEILIEEGHAVAYFGGSKEEIQMKHMANREKLLREGIVSQADVDKATAIMEKKKK